MDIIETYKEAREQYIRGWGHNPKGNFDRLLANAPPELEKIATFAANSIETDGYESVQACYPFADLDMLEKLHKGRGILHPEEALKALYHLFEDYLKPDVEQAYRLGPHLQTAIGFIYALDLQDKFDLTYLDRAIQKAIDGGHNAVAINWQRIRDEIAATQDRK